MTTLYEQSMQLQAIMDKTNAAKLYSQQKIIKKIGLASINERWSSELVRAARTSKAYFIPDGLTLESYIYPIQEFGEVVLKGCVPKVDCVDILGRKTVALPFFDAVILGPRHEIEVEFIDIDQELEEYDTVLPLDTRLKRPLHVPVENLEFIALAA
jgi:hypothetical protein